jgi:HEPN domain-containing protein
MTFTDPVTGEEWGRVAGERKIDASELLHAKRTLAAYYFFGFAAECFAKALVADKQRASRGKKLGHDILPLLDEAGIERRSIPLDLRACAENRDVSVRYQAEWPSELEIAELDRMAQLATWIERRAARSLRRVSRRKRPGRLGVITTRGTR